MLIIKEPAKLLAAKLLTLPSKPLVLTTGRSNLNSVNYISSKGFRINSCGKLNRLNFNSPVAAAHCNYSRTVFVQLANQSTETNRAGQKHKQISLHDIGEGISEVVVKEWKVKLGDSVRQADEICEVESDKAAVIIQSPFDGLITRLHYDEGSIAKVGLPLVDISSDQMDGDGLVAAHDEVSFNLTVDSKSNEQPSTNDHHPSDRLVVATLPSVRRLAKEKKVDLSQVRPSGKRGQILKEDLLAFLATEQPLQAAQQAGAGQERAPEREFEANDWNKTTTTTTTMTTKGQKRQLETRVALRGIQKAMFKSMTQSLKIPHFSYSDEIDMTRLVEASKRRQLSSFPKELQSALGGDEIKLNASLDDSGEHLIMKSYHNIGVAVDTPAGLIVPNVKNVQDLSIIEINLELQRLRSLGYSSKLSLEDLSGGTFTLSNIGAIGGIFGVPVLVAPEIVIGALGRTRKLPRFSLLDNNKLEERHVMQIVWSADHRIVDGATLSRFSNLLKHYLEEPESGLLKLA